MIIFLSLIQAEEFQQIQLFLVCFSTETCRWGLPVQVPEVVLKDFRKGTEGVDVSFQDESESYGFTSNPEAGKDGRVVFAQNESGFFCLFVFLHLELSFNDCNGKLILCFYYLKALSQEADFLHGINQVIDFPCCLQLNLVNWIVIHCSDASFPLLQWKKYLL